jgi:hypothetical protein
MYLQVSIGERRKNKVELIILIVLVVLAFIFIPDSHGRMYERPEPTTGPPDIKTIQVVVNRVGKGKTKFYTDEED